MKSEKKDRRSFPLLGLKFSVNFIIFGLIIGYFSLIFSSMFRYRDLIDSFHDALASVPSVQTSSAEPKQGIFAIHHRLRDLAAGNPEKLKDLLHTIRKDYNILDTAVCYRKTGGAWKVYFDITGNDEGSSAVSVFDRNALEKTVTKGNFLRSGIYLGQKGMQSVYLDLSPETGSTKFVLQLGINQESLGQVLNTHKDFLHYYFIFLLIISTLVGNLFAMRITRPIKRLSHEAGKAASGNYNRSFALRRRDEIGSLSRSLDKMSKNIRQHLEDIQFRMKTMETMNRIDKSVLSPISRVNLMDNILGIVSDQYSGFPIVIVEKTAGYFSITRREDGKYRKDNIPADAGSPLLSELTEEGFFHFTGKKAVLITDTLSIAGKGHVYFFPIVLDNMYAGSVCFCPDTEFSQRDLDAIALLTDQTGVALQSVKIFEDREALLLGTITALSRSVDAKSKWTAGHSERVAQYASAVCERISLPRKSIEQLRMAAVLHDIGKIGVPESILDKPDKLTDAEFTIIRSHPKAGAEILSGIPNMEQVINAVLFHHEHFDGSGYPKGLQGEEIPLTARIITLADVYDAVTAERPYRRGMSHEEACDFLKQQSGKLFDPQLLLVFLEII